MKRTEREKVLRWTPVTESDPPSSMTVLAECAVESPGAEPGTTEHLVLEYDAGADAYRDASGNGVGTVTRWIPLTDLAELIP